jgi:hypothetical protein
MSGIRYYNFREGDRAEYLANYLLSGIGLVTPVLRQEDIGIDFYCTLADNETGNLSFNHQFLIQAKSDKKDIIFGGLNNKGKWKEHELIWLKNRESPIFIAVVDKTKIEMEIFSISPLRFIEHENPNFAKVIFRFRKDDDDSDIGRPTNEEKEELNGLGDCSEYIVDLGFPLLKITNDCFDNKPELKEIKNNFRQLIKVEQENLVFNRLNLPYFKWVLKKTDNKIGYGWMHYDYEKAPIPVEELIKPLSQSLISLAISLKLNGKDNELNAFKEIIKLIPKEEIYKELRDAHGDIFE